ncbi:MAG: prepilin peptidase [Bdellovibrionota bacterium]|jgi:leader peptidase (prepilin peptidase)/N-methyltransferase
MIDLVDIFIILFGLIIGSFLTVCIYRIPYGREKGPGSFLDTSEEVEEGSEDLTPPDSEEINLTTPKRSFCPNCKNQLKWYHNIPLFSWIFLRGKCAYCHARIPFRYPLVEILSALFCYLSFQMMPDLQTALLIYTLCCALIVISFIDIDYYIIPNVISIPGIWLAIIIVSANYFFVRAHFIKTPFFAAPVAATLQEGFYGFLAGGGLLYVLAKTFVILRKKEGLGFGDVKLMSLVGILLGPEGAIYAIMVGSIFGSVFGIVQLLFQGKKLGYPLPFGPYLALGTVLYLFTDPEIPINILHSITGSIATAIWGS